MIGRSVGALLALMLFAFPAHGETRIGLTPFATDPSSPISGPAFADVVKAELLKAIGPGGKYAWCAVTLVDAQPDFDAMIEGEITPKDGKFLVSARIRDARTTKVLATGDGVIETPQELVEILLEQICRKNLPPTPGSAFWIASVAIDMPEFEKEFWMVRCDESVNGKWTIMPTAPGFKTIVHRGELVLDAGAGRGDYWLEATEASDRGAYRETGWGGIEGSEADGFVIITLHGTWSSRTFDGKGGYSARAFEFGDMTFGAQKRTGECPIQ